MKVKKLAAIDIGSNAIRILISNVFEVEGSQPIYMKSEMVRVPIRLGEDSFTVGEISSKNIKRIIKAMKAIVSRHSVCLSLCISRKNGY